MTTVHMAARRSRHGVLWGGLVVVGAVVLGRQVVSGGPMLRMIAAVVVIGVLAVPAIERPRQAVVLLFGLLPFLGMIRHMFISASGTATLDPLLLVTSAVAILVFASLALKDQIDFSGTALATCVFLLLVVGLIQVFNPIQGGLLIGLTGIMINLVPLTFFFIARSIADDEMVRRVVHMVLIVGGIVSAYGLYQVFVGFPAFDQAWIRSGGYGALTVGGTVRPFSTFNNAAEYASYAHIAFAVALAGALFGPRRRRAAMIALVALTAYAGFLTGSRGFTVKITAAAILLLAARAKNRVLSLGVMVLLGTTVILWASLTTTEDGIHDREVGVGQLVQQQVRALSDPFDRTKSTLPVHAEQFARGVARAVTEDPWGLGTGATTRGAVKFGGEQAGTEFDIGDVFQSLGVAGGGLFVAVILLAIAMLRRVRKALSGYVWTAIAVAAFTSIGAWLNGGYYAVTPLIWFMIGAADGAYKRLRDARSLDASLAG